MKVAEAYRVIGHAAVTRPTLTINAIALFAELPLPLREVRPFSVNADIVRRACPDAVVAATVLCWLIRKDADGISVYRPTEEIQVYWNKFAEPSTSLSVYDHDPAGGGFPYTRVLSLKTFGEGDDAVSALLLMVD